MAAQIPLEIAPIDKSEMFHFAYDGEQNNDMGQYGQKRRD